MITVYVLTCAFLFEPEAFLFSSVCRFSIIRRILKPRILILVLSD